MKKILLVNDCKFESVVMKDYLNDIGYSVQAADEYDVFMQIRKFQPDIVIANLIMKDTTGDKLIEYIKSINSEIICLLSSCDLIELKDFIENKVDEVIHTPVSRLKLSQVLNKVLSESGRVREENNFYFCSYCRQNLTVSGKKFLFCPYCGQRIKN